jgi:CHASE2 domain-containing sensor protein
MSLISRVPTITRVLGAVLAAFLVTSAVGSFFGREDGDSGELAWIALLLVAAAGMITGLTMAQRRPIPGAVFICVGALLAGWSYFWFPPLLLVSLLMVVGAIWSLRISNADRRLRANAPAVIA